MSKNKTFPDIHLLFQESILRCCNSFLIICWYMLVHNEFLAEKYGASFFLPSRPATWRWCWPRSAANGSSPWHNFNWRRVSPIEAMPKGCGYGLNSGGPKKQKTEDGTSKFELLFVRICRAINWRLSVAQTCSSCTVCVTIFQWLHIGPRSRQVKSHCWLIQRWNSKSSWALAHLSRRVWGNWDCVVNTNCSRFTISHCKRFCLAIISFHPRGTATLLCPIAHERPSYIIPPLCATLKGGQPFPNLSFQLTFYGDFRSPPVRSYSSWVLPARRGRFSDHRRVGPLTNLYKEHLKNMRFQKCSSITCF